MPNRHVNAITGRLSLRPPQRDSLEILHRVTELAPLAKDADVASALAAIRAEYPKVTDFERDFPSLCFALATGVGKTRLMGAFISYLHLEHGVKNFFVLAPNLTIYNKLIADFTPNTPKYVFKGISEFATAPPAIITGDNYETMATTLFDLVVRCKINIFNISKINSEVRGGKSPKVKRLSEYIGESYFAYLAALPDLVMLMDESHRYRASAGERAINELKPVLGLELTATPFVETAKGTKPFRNVIYDYPLARAMADGFVKNPAVVTRKDFNPAGMTTEAIEQLKLEDGVRLHEKVKVQLATYAANQSQPLVKPFVLVIARDTTHAKQLLDLIESQNFFEGRYKGKAIQVDSSKTGAEEEEMILRLLKVEQTDEPTEIVIHVNMLKEGWDVTNLYTIVPLRAANAKTLVEQSIGRGLRLPYGRRTGVPDVDRLNIVAHDRFQEIVDEANKPDSVIRMTELILDGDELQEKPVTVISQSNVEAKLGLQPAAAQSGSTPPAPLFTDPAEKAAAHTALQVIKGLGALPSARALLDPEVRATIVKAVQDRTQPAQLPLEGMPPAVDVANVVQAVTNLYVQQTIDIPRIVVLPKGDVTSGYHPFHLDLAVLRHAAPSEELWVQYLGNNQREVIGVGEGGIEEARLEDYIVRGLVDFDDISYDDQADLLYDLAGQVVAHYRTYLSDHDTGRVLHLHQREIVQFIYAQMQPHAWESAAEYEVKVTKGFTELRPSAYTASGKDAILDFRYAPPEKNRIAAYLFGHFEHCLYEFQKFQSDSERKLAVILEREKVKWFKPAKGQFQIFYKSGAELREYVPDFVAETESVIYMLEPKMKSELDDAEVLAKQAAAITWCSQASVHSAAHGGKPWRYALIPHDVIADNMTLGGLVAGSEPARW